MANEITVSVGGKSGSVNVSSGTKQVDISITKDLSAYYSALAKDWAIKTNGVVENTDYSAKYYANEAASSANEASNYSKSSQEIYDVFQQATNDVLSSIETSIQDGVDTINNNTDVAITGIKTEAQKQIQNIESTGFYVRDDKLYFINSKGEEEEFKSGGGSVLFDTKLTDHILTYEESEGWALQGTYVYKEAVAGSRYGYPDFYAKCVEEFENSTNSQVYLKSNVTPVGTLTDNKGLLSGFSASNYASLPNHFLTAVSNADSWEAEFKFTTGSSVSSPERQIIFHSGVGSSTVGKSGFVIDLYQSKLRVIYSTQGSTGDNISITASVNTQYFVKANFDASTLTFNAYYKLNEPDAWTLIGTSTVKDRLSESSDWNTTEIGCSSASTGYYFNGGSVDLNGCYINIDGQNWWSGTDTIIKNPNGHIFYDIAQKEQVDEFYNTNGIAWYYGIDKENERIFLPRTKWFIQPSGEITEVNTVNEAGLPNITGKLEAWAHILKSGSGAFSWYKTGTQMPGQTASSGNGGSTNFDASRSNPIYGNSTTVQPPSINQLLYICVGNTNVESAVTDVVDVTTTENDTVPLGYSTYQNGIVPNTSWLKSQGQWNDGNIYTTFYNEFVQKIGQPFASGYVKEITDEYDDYDLVINQDEMTFRLPLLDGSEDIVSDRYIDLTLGASGDTYIAPANGWFYFAKATLKIDSYVFLGNNTTGVEAISRSSIDKDIARVNLEVKAGDEIRILYDATGDTKAFKFVYAQGNGSLYFKVANAVQNLELLNAGEVLEAVNNVVPNNRELITGWSFPSSKYIDLTLNASGSIYTAPANGWFVLHKVSGATGKIIVINNTVGDFGSSVMSSGTSQIMRVYVPFKKGQTAYVAYDATGATNVFRFVYAQGEV